MVRVVFEAHAEAALTFYRSVGTTNLIHKADSLGTQPEPDSNSA